MFACLKGLVVKVAIFAALIYGINLWLRVKDYHFDKNEVHKIGKQFVGQSGIDAAPKIAAALRKRYGNLILNDADLEWIFFKAGGSPGAACLFYASLTEYVLVYGTEIAGNGHSGRLWANISDTLLKGTLRKWSEKTHRVEEIPEGSFTEHFAFEGAFVGNPAGIWMLEYARGFIPAMFPFFIADNIFSSADPVCLYQTFRVFGKSVISDMARSIGLF